MATVTGLTAERMMEIEDATIVGAEIVAGNLILTTHDGTEINAGPVTGPVGPPGPTGPSGGSIPGEVKLWPGTVLPNESTYGKWVWADGAVYPIGTYPLAAAHIADAWNTLGGLLSDPGSGNFRVPDLRGLVPSGIDAMPGGSRANRVARSDGAVQAKPIGEEQHTLILSKIPAHSHRGGGLAGAGGVTQNNAPSFTGTPVPAHNHGIPATAVVPDSLGSVNTGNNYGTAGLQVWGHAHADAGAHTPAGTVASHGHSINTDGGGGAHENMQPTVMVPYIVSLAG